MSRRRKNSRLHRYVLALWALVIVGGLAVAVWHVIVWAAITAAVGGGAYLLGRRQGGGPIRRRQRIGAVRADRAARPAAARSAFPPLQDPAEAALLADPAANPDVPTVLRRALASAGQGRSERITPAPQP
jgi:hypothetical protein